MVNIQSAPGSCLVEIAEMIKEDTLAAVNEKVSDFQPKDTFYTRYGKRAFDFILSLIAVILTAPINLIIGIVTFFDVGTPLIFKQSRIGKDRKLFTIYKFRNMTNDRDANGELLPPQQRVTKWGKFVRKTSLDELMNFISILKGDMSFIGPRPLIKNYVSRLHNRHLMIYSVKPGLECPMHQDLDHAATWQDRLDNYVWYAENVSLLVDLKLVWRMFSLVFSKESTKVRSTSEHGAFLGYDMDGNVICSNAVPEEYINRYLAKHHYTSIESITEDRHAANTADDSIKAQVN